MEKGNVPTPKSASKGGVSSRTDSQRPEAMQPSAEPPVNPRVEEAIPEIAPTADAAQSIHDIDLEFLEQMEMLIAQLPPVTSLSKALATMRAEGVEPEPTSPNASPEAENEFEMAGGEEEGETQTMEIEHPTQEVDEEEELDAADQETPGPKVGESEEGKATEAEETEKTEDNPPEGRQTVDEERIFDDIVDEMAEQPTHSGLPLEETEVEQNRSFTLEDDPDVEQDEASVRLKRRRGQRVITDDSEETEETTPPVDKDDPTVGGPSDIEERYATKSTGEEEAVNQETEAKKRAAAEAKEKEEAKAREEQAKAEKERLRKKRKADGT